MTDIRADAPVEVPFLFQQSQKRVGGSLGVSFVVHAAAVALFLFLANRHAIQNAATALFPETLPKDIVWLDSSDGPALMLVAQLETVFAAESSKPV